MSESNLVTTLRETAEQLEKWALESERGGWSTHQVVPMRQRAALTWQALGRHACPFITDRRVPPGEMWMVQDGRVVGKAKL